MQRRTCKRCDLGYIIKDHIKCVFQLLTNELPQYNFRLQTTKCLNTAVMLMFFFLGERGLKMAEECDTRSVIARHESNLENNADITKELKSQLFSKREKARTVYYILLSDGYFPKPLGTQTAPSTPEQVYFPGHVFVLEKIWDESKQEHYFYFYQSYINQYTLQGHVEHNKGLRISHKRATELLTDLEQVLTSPTWSANNVQKWYDMTFASSETLKDSHSRNRFFLCFRKAKTNVCLGKLKKYLVDVSRKLDTLITSNPSLQGSVYGNPDLYSQDSLPLTNGEMQQQVKLLLAKINKSVT